MIIYGFEFSIFELIFSGILLLAFIHQLYFYLHYINLVHFYKKKLKKNAEPKLNVDVPVSIIICGKDEIQNLQKFLPSVLIQDYPNFEVIVVNDGSTDETGFYLEGLKKIYSNLRTTFVPAEATNLSTKKLALTLGIKAAKNDWLLFTDADCMPEENTWLQRMANNFNPGIEFVLGYGAYFNRKSYVNKLITYDTLFNSLQFLGFAYQGKPYMGVGRNMAYRKEVFFRQKGFASYLHLRSGDDDLIVNRGANKFNTKIEIAPDSITLSEPKKNFKEWILQKERHLSVSSYYSPKSRFQIAVEPFTRGLFYLMLIFSAVFGNIITLIPISFLFVVRFIVQLSIINKSAHHFGERRYFLSIPFFDIILPLINLYLLIFGKMGSKSRNIRWK